MNQYYLMAQLPSLDAIGEGAPLPITEEYFFELCRRFLGGKAQKALDMLTLVPERYAEPTGDALVDEWNKGEAQLRLALAYIRASKMKKSFEVNTASLPSALLQAARTAADINDPMQAELYLNNFRLSFLETLRPSDAFSQSSVYYYGIKLKLLTRIRSFNAQSGESEYKKIYNSIINEENREKV